MSRELEKCSVLFAHAIENADGGLTAAGQSNDDAARAAERALQRFDLLCRKSKVLFKLLFQNVHSVLAVKRLGCFNDIGRGDGGARRKNRDRGSEIRDQVQVSECGTWNKHPLLLSLLVAQRFDRVDAEGTASRSGESDERNREKQRRDHDEGQWIERRDSVQHGTHSASHQHG